MIRARHTQDQSSVAIFIAISLFFGVLFAILTPPFRVADEPVHFLRAYQISEGQIAPKWAWDNSTKREVPGGMFPKSVTRLEDRFAHFGSQTFPYLEELQAPLGADDRKFVAFSAAQTYSPICYLPQALGIALGRWVGAPAVVLLYLGRLMSVLITTSILGLAIARMPSLKWLLATLALSPMNIFQRASVSADGMTFSLAFLVIALSLRRILDNEEPKKWGLSLLFSSSLLSLCKSAYGPLSFLAGRPLKLKDWKPAVRDSLIIGFMIFTPLLAWTWFTAAIPNLSAHAGERPHFISTIFHPLSFLKVMVETLRTQTPGYVSEWVGTLGWLDIRLAREFKVFYVLSTALIFLVDLAISRPIPRSVRFRAFGLFVFLALGVLSAMYFGFSPVGSPYIQGVQGRYFVPIVPLLFIGFSSARLKLARGSLHYEFRPKMAWLAAFTWVMDLSYAVIFAAFHF